MGDDEQEENKGQDEAGTTRAEIGSVDGPGYGLGGTLFLLHEGFALRLGRLDLDQLVMFRDRLDAVGIGLRLERRRRRRRRLFLVGRRQGHELGEFLVLRQQVVVRALRLDLPAFEPDDPVAPVEHVELVRGQDAALVGQEPADGLVHDVTAHVRVHRRQRVVHENYVRVEVDRASNVDALLLPTRHRDAPLADLRLVAVGKHGEVRMQGTRAGDPVVEGAVHVPAKGDVVPHGGVLDPGVLRAKRPRRAKGHTSARLAHVARQCGQQGGFAGTHTANNADELGAAHR